MCPPATTPPDAIDLYWSDEQIFLLLEKVKNGSALPDNVSEDINPYQFLPSNLPSKIWYLVQSTESKKSEHGFWKAKGEACRIYQNGSIYGWRSTLEFFEGPNGRKTGWVLQEYKTGKEGYNEKSQKQSRSLCTVFQCCGGSPNDIPSGGKTGVASRGNVMDSTLLSAPNANRSSGVRSTSESQAKSKDAGSTQSPLSCERLLSSILRDENYMELDDLLPAVDEAIDDPRNEALISQLLMEDGLELDDLTGNLEPLPAANKAEDLTDQILKEGCFIELDDLKEDITEDFLEMNDIDGILSLPSSSSGNSSHHNSFRSEDDFFATVRNMDDDHNGDLKGKGSSYKCRNMGPVKPDEVIVQLAPSAGQITEKNVQKTLHRSATKNKFKKYLCFLPF